MRRALLIVALAMMIGLAPGRVAALSCVHPRDQLQDYALLVEAEVVQVGPQGRGSDASFSPQAITLKVRRYFKGEGPAELHAVFDGLGWATMDPVGSTVIMGFYVDQQSGRFTAGPCTLKMPAQSTNAFEQEMLTLIHGQYGEGKAPTGADVVRPIGDEPGRTRGRWLLWGGLGAALAVGTVIGYVYRKR